MIEKISVITNDNKIIIDTVSKPREFIEHSHGTKKNT